MKKVVVTISAILMVCGTYAQEAKYVKVDEGIASSVVENVLKKADFENDKDRVYSKSLIEDAFKAYFTHTKVKGKVFEQDTINAMHKTVSQLNTRLKKAEKTVKKHEEHIAKLELQVKDNDSICKIVEKQELCLRDSSNLIRAHQQEVVRLTHLLDERSRKDSMEMALVVEEYKVKYDSLAKIHKIVANELSALRQANDSLSKMTRYFAGVHARKDEMEKAVNKIYRDCIASSLCAGDADHEDFVVKVRDYKMLIDVLGVPCEKDVEEQCAYIVAMKDVKSVVNKALASMKIKYDEVTNKQLLGEMSQMSIETLTEAQKKEWNALLEGVRMYPNVTRNFKNGILEDLKSLACIPNDNARKQGFEYMDSHIEMFFNYRSKDGVLYYGPYYDYLNRLTDQLRKELNFYKKNSFKDENVFKSYLDELAKNL